jgi:serralysin
MALFTTFVSSGFQVATGSAVGDDTQFTIIGPDGLVQTYYGSGFTYDSAGRVTGGVIDSTTLSIDGVQQYSIAFLGLPTEFLADALFNGDAETVRQTLLAFNDTIYGSAGDDVLYGYDGDDTIVGGDGNDTLVGGAGADAMDGGDGDDVFLFASGADYAADEQIHGGSGTDAIRFTSTTPGDFLLLGPGFFSDDVTGIEIVMISDAAGDTSGTTPLGVNARIVRDTGLTIVGNDGDNFLGGTVLGDAIFGNGGDDMLHGGSGDDLLDGGAGSDTYVSFASPGPVTVDLAAGFALDGDGGTDTLIGIENADGSDNTDDTLIGDAGANVLRGLTGNDRLEGGAGDDTLDGGAGADTMLGGPGNDTYVQDDAGDVIAESRSSGIDTVLSSVSTELPNHVENLTLAGSAAEGTGNRLDNALAGNGAANVLRGLQGDDTLRGGLANDVLSGGPGRDAFVFDVAPGPADADLVTDFKSGQDALHLDDWVFTEIGAPGRFGIDDDRFASGDGLTAGADATDRILYDTSAGNLYYDADGDGAGAALLFATLQGAPNLHADDIVVI